MLERNQSYCNLLISLVYSSLCRYTSCARSSFHSCVIGVSVPSRFPTTTFFATRTTAAEGEEERMMKKKKKKKEERRKNVLLLSVVVLS